jgi:hypothetical protein
MPDTEGVVLDSGAMGIIPRAQGNDECVQLTGGPFRDNVVVDLDNRLGHKEKPLLILVLKIGAYQCSGTRSTDPFFLAE